MSTSANFMLTALLGTVIFSEELPGRNNKALDVFGTLIHD